MGNHENHHGHGEAQQNEIAGPVVFAVLLFVVAVTIIGFWTFWS